MRNVSATVDIQAQPERVVAVLCDVERWPDWNSTVTSVKRMDVGPFQVGSRARIRQPKLLPAVWEVKEVDERRGFTWVTRTPGVQLTGRHNVERNASGSRVTLSLQFSGPLAPLVARLYGNLIKQYLANEASGLKQRSESLTLRS